MTGRREHLFASPRARLTIFVAFLHAVVLLLSGCSRCSSSRALAVLAEEHGTIERDTANAVGTWSAAKVSAEFFVGDGVRSGKTSTAVLTLSDESRLSLEESTVVRFLEKPSGSAAERIDLQMGEATIEVGKEPLSLETDVGLAIIDPGTRLSLKKDGKGIRYEVSVGLARFEDKSGEKTSVGPGEGVIVAVGAAKIERIDPKATAETKPPEPPPSATPPPPATGDVAAKVTGNGASVRTPGASTFTKVAPGESSFAAGSTLKLAGGTSMDVKRGGEHATLRGAGEFVIAEAGRSFIQTRGGGVAFASVSQDVQVAVPGGTIVVKTGSSADVRVDADAAKVSVIAGSAELRGPSGSEQLSAGEEGTLATQGKTAVAGRGPGYVDFVAAGGSFAVHDPKPPTAIGFATGSACPEGAIVDVGGKGKLRSRGTGVVSVLVPPGSHKYQVFCVTGAGVSGQAAASGGVSVLRDSGTARIPRTAATTLVDTDGRNYTVLYQNILPKISVRWPNAPAAGSYTLSVSSPGGKSESHSSGSPSWSFPSGALREGAHRLTFDAGSARSKTTTLELRFDNAAPTATLTSPPDGFAPGSTVTVAGVALEGWVISAGGKDLPLDGQQRFSGEVTAPSGERALAVQFVNPRRGVHYYLRRASGR